MYLLYLFLREWDKDVGRDTANFLLPGLQKLRQICNNAAEDLIFETKKSIDDVDVEESDEFNYGSSEATDTNSNIIKKRKLPSSTIPTSKFKSPSRTATATSLPPKKTRSFEQNGQNEKNATIDLEGSSKLKVF